MLATAMGGESVEKAGAVFDLRPKWLATVGRSKYAPLRTVDVDVDVQPKTKPPPLSKQGLVLNKTLAMTMSSRLSFSNELLCLPL